MTAGVSHDKGDNWMENAQTITIVPLCKRHLVQAFTSGGHTYTHQYRMLYVPGRGVLRTATEYNIT